MGFLLWYFKKCTKRNGGELLNLWRTWYLLCKKLPETKTGRRTRISTSQSLFSCQLQSCIWCSIYLRLTNFTDWWPTNYYDLSNKHFWQTTSTILLSIHQPGTVYCPVDFFVFVWELKSSPSVSPLSGVKVPLGICEMVSHCSSELANGRYIQYEKETYQHTLYLLSAYNYKQLWDLFCYRVDVG